MKHRHARVVRRHVSSRFILKHGIPLGQVYMNKVLAIQPSNLLAYWPLNEMSGVIAYDKGGFARNGTYTGVTLSSTTGPDGQPAPFFDGAASFVDIYSASLSADFNGSEGTTSVWIKVADIGVWTDATTRYIFNLSTNPANSVAASKLFTAGTLQQSYLATAVSQAVNTGGHVDTDWIHLATTWSFAADQVTFYINGLPVGPSSTGLGVWSGTLSSSTTILGSFNTTPGNVWRGWLAHPMIWDMPLVPAKILSLATI